MFNVIVLLCILDFASCGFIQRNQVLIKGTLTRDGTHVYLNCLYRSKFCIGFDLIVKAAESQIRSSVISIIVAIIRQKATIK